MFSYQVTIAAFSFILFYAVINPTRAKTRQITRINTKLDIILMYDESSSMKGRNYGQIQFKPIDLSFVWVAAREWLLQYGDMKGTEQSRFAVIGCKSKLNDDSDVKPYLYLDGTGGPDVIRYNTWAEKLFVAAVLMVNQTIFETNNEFDNVAGCPRSVSQFVLQPNKWDRMDALNVVFCKNS